MTAGPAANAVFAKARAMYGKRILPEEYEKLIAGASLSEAISFLKAHPGYRDCFSTYDPSILRRREAERVLRREIFSRYLKLVHYIREDRDGFYHYVVQEWEIAELLDCISYLLQGKTDEYIISLPTYFVPYASFDLMQLARANNLDQLNQVLLRTPYAKVVQSVSRRDGVTITDFETALYCDFYKRVFTEIRRQFHGTQAQQLTDIFNMRAELFNVLCILRGKAFFKLTAEQIQEHLLPYHFYLSSKKIRLLSQAPGYQKAVDLLKSTEYERKDALFPIDYMEKSYKKIIFLQSKKMMRFSSSPAVVLAAYLSLCDIETANLFNIIEGLRYGLAPDEIRSLLIY